MKSVKSTITTVIVGLMVIIVPLVAAASIVAVPFEIIGSIFKSVGPVFASSEEKGDLVEFIQQSLLVTETRQSLVEHYAEYRNIDGIEVPLHYYVVMQYLMGWPLELVTPDYMSIMATAAVSTQSDNLTVNQQQSHGVATVAEYVSLLLTFEPFQSELTATSGTIIDMINAVGDLDSLVVIDDDLKDRFYGRFIYPLASSFPVSAEIGWYDPWNTGTLKRHEGIDVAAPEGTPIYAIYDAKVEVTSFEIPSYSRGNYVILDLGEGITVRYYHMQERPLVRLGDNVPAGTVIGYVGNTGDSTGPHLHLEIRIDDVPINPRELIDFD